MPIKFKMPQLHWHPYRTACLVGNRISQQMLTKELEALKFRIERKGGKLRYDQFIDAQLLIETSEWMLRTRDNQRKYEIKYGIFDPADRDRWKFNFVDEDIIDFIECWIAGAHEDGRAYLRKFVSNSDGELFARVGKATALELTQVPRDVLESFIVEDVYAGTLVCPKTDERLFAAHIDFTSKAIDRPSSEGQIVGVNKEQGRRPQQRENAKRAISALGYDQKCPENSTNESLLQEVNEWLSEHGKNNVSRDTMRRAFKKFAESK